MRRDVPEWIALLGAEVRLRIDELIPEAHALRVAELLEEIDEREEEESRDHLHH